jgi:hypothetical protein
MIGRGHRPGGPVAESNSRTAAQSADAAQAQLAKVYARWATLREWLSESGKQAAGAAALCDEADGTDAVRFRAEALGYKRALEKMGELEEGR